MEPASSSHIRRSRRVSATIPISLLMEREDSKTEHGATTVDLSRYGVRVRTALALFPGQMVGVVPSRDSGQVIPTRVVWVQQAESGHGSLAGLEFLNPLLT